MAREKGVARKAGGGTRPPDVGTEDGDGTGYTQRIEAAQEQAAAAASRWEVIRKVIGWGSN